MAEIKMYRTYEHYRDPVIDEITEAIDKENLLKKPSIVADIATISPGTVMKWLDGTTRRPQYATVMAVMIALGYQRGNFRHVEKLNVVAARKAAAKWRERQEAKKANAKERLIAARKAARAGHASGATAQKR